MALFLPSVDSFLQAGSIKISSQMDTVTKLKITGRNYQKTESSFKKFCQQMDVPKVKSVSCTITFFSSLLSPSGLAREDHETMVKCKQSHGI